MNDLQGVAIVYMAPRYACNTDSSRACSDIQVQCCVSERSKQTFGFIGTIVLRNRLKNVNRQSFAAHHHFVRLIVQNGPSKFQLGTVRTP
jgi:hypothetical protein